MIQIASLSREEREELFLNTAHKIGMPPAIVEKDFWVCYMLDYLFHRCEWKGKMVFKGGTSLSKAYHLIERFSEDIDLILDWRLLGYRIEEPWEPRSNTQQDKFSESSERKTIALLEESLIPMLQRDVSAEIEETARVFLENKSEPTVDFAYPQIFTDSSILQVIRLEIGALASWSPSQDAVITSFAAEQYPEIFTHPDTIIRTAVPERTFWEKVTILHREANRVSGRFPDRYSRHYYDLYQLATSTVKDQAFQKLYLLKAVIAFKMKFYRCPWAKYEEAIPGTIKLIPQEQYFSALQEDYGKMKNMIYGEVPSFDELLSSVRLLEAEINSLK